MTFKMFDSLIEKQDHLGLSDLTISPVIMFPLKKIHIKMVNLPECMFLTFTGVFSIFHSNLVTIVKYIVISPLCSPPKSSKTKAFIKRIFGANCRRQNVSNWYQTGPGGRALQISFHTGGNRKSSLIFICYYLYPHL
jgi:hypothetical protein